MMTTTTSDQIWISISSSLIKELNLRVMKQQSCSTSRNNALMGYLALHAWSEWLQEDFQQVSFPPQTVQNARWEIVEGLALQWLGKKIVLIPSDALDTEGITIPQEWVDLDTWSADYYVGVQIDLEDHYISIWGYASYATIKHHGQYDQISRTYTIDRDFMSTNMETLEWACTLSPQEALVTESLPALTLDFAQQILEEATHYTTYSPRLSFPFFQWGALVNNANLLQSLYQKRIDQISRNRINLSNWLAQKFEESIDLGWRTISDLLSNEPQWLLSTSYRSQALTQQAKLFNFQVALDSYTIVLLLAIEPTEKGTWVLARAIPKSTMTLPPGLMLYLTSARGKVLQKVVARERDKLIQLPEATIQEGIMFQICLELDGTVFREEFIINSEVKDG